MQVESGAVSAPDNPYAAPQARVADAALATEGALYVVAPRKFLLLTIATLNWYHVYWFYRQWAQLNRRDRDYWPVMRAIFAVFFTHSLFERVEEQIRKGRVAYEWIPMLLATVYVVALVGTRVIDTLARNGVELGWFMWLPLLLSILEIVVLYRAQLAINAAERDPGGSSNSTLTFANYAWIAFGGLMWLFVLFAIYVMFNPAVFDLAE